MSTVIRLDCGGRSSGYQLFTKGASEIVLQKYLNQFVTTELTLVLFYEFPFSNKPFDAFIANDIILIASHSVHIIHFFPNR
jgi:hypothetical protein